MGRGVPLAGIVELRAAVNVPQCLIKQPSAKARRMMKKTLGWRAKAAAAGRLKLQPDTGTHRVCQHYLVPAVSDKFQWLPGKSFRFQRKPTRTSWAPTFLKVACPLGPSAVTISPTFS